MNLKIHLNCVQKILALTYIYIYVYAQQFNIQKEFKVKYPNELTSPEPAMPASNIQSGQQ